MSSWELSFDGAIPPGRPRFGYVLDCDGAEMAKGCGSVPLLSQDRTVNVAEYGGLVAGLKVAEQCVSKGDYLLVRGDSQLVIRQMQGKYKIKKSFLRLYASEAWKTIERLQKQGVKVELLWVPREENRRADVMSKSSGATEREA